ncbi:hypothetical protein ZWY2020_029044 [Hordeum vulgare]|nr:hypothetical protein ZWY2020_029044 [Hordeum vulgare]
MEGVEVRARAVPHIVNICNAMKESFDELKMNVQELHLVMKREDDSTVWLKIQSHIRLSSKMQKHVKKVGKVTDFDHNDNSRVIMILTEAQETTGHAKRLVSEADMAFALRSISLPSRHHTSEAEVQEDLHSLETSITSSITIETMCDGLRRLGDIYGAVEEIIQLPSNQVCSSQQRKILDAETECSLELLDLCNNMQEISVELKAIIQELQVALRKGEDTTVQAKIQSYIRLVKKAGKQFKKTTRKATSDKMDCGMVSLLVNAREMTISLLESAVHLLSKQIQVPKQSLVSKAFHKRKAVVCEEQLQDLECSIRDFESGVGHLFRRLIQSRVSLLNILSS